MLERCGFQVQKDMNESLTDQVQKASRDRRVFLEKPVQVSTGNRANAGSLGSLRGAMIHALANAPHFPKNCGWFEISNDQLLCARCSERLHPAFLEKEQYLAALSRLKEDMPCAK